MNLNQARGSKPLISRLNSGYQPVLHLSSRQKKALLNFIKMVDNNEFALRANPCICGKANDTLIAECDRYGIALATQLCRNCGIMRSDPYYTPESIADFYGRHYREIYTSHQDIPSFFEVQQKKGHRMVNRLSLSFATFSTVYEIGCGAGGILHSFQLRGSRVVGCDFDTEYLDYGRSKGVDLEVGDASVLAQHGRANLIILSHVLEHFLDPLQELGRLQLLLQPDGMVYIELPGIFSIRTAYHDPALFFQNAHAWHFCLESLDYLMNMAGFERVAGDETIKAIYKRMARPPEIKPVENGNLHRNIWAALTYFDLMRHFPRFQSGMLWLAKTPLVSKLLSSVRSLRRRSDENDGTRK